MSPLIALSKKESREALRDKGQFWTPDWVAEAMMAYVIKDSQMIFDPAVGSGAFFKALNKINTSRRIEFYGTDVDKSVLKEEVYKDSGCKIECRDFIKNPPNRTFKAIVANPPYIRHHRMGNETKDYLKLLSKKITGKAIDGRAGYHIYFLLQALYLLENKGKLAFIMPADTCEGAFAEYLWNWIGKNFCLEAVVTFAEKATPFPSIDTNAMIFMIRKEQPKTDLFWVKVNVPSSELYKLISSNFEPNQFENLEVTKRNLHEAIKTGLSRPTQNKEFKFHLGDFASVMRGIATGANDFFFLTRKQAQELKIPKEFLKSAIGRTRDISDEIITQSTITKLDQKGRPTLLLSVDNKDAILPKSLTAYLKKGADLGIPRRPLIKQRKLWHKMEKRQVPPLLFAYLGRRNLRFIKNDANILPLTGFLCIYPNETDESYIDALWKILNHPESLENLRLVGKSYGSGAIKVEPRSLEKLPISDHLVEKYGLKKKQSKLSFS